MNIIYYLINEKSKIYIEIFIILIISKRFLHIENFNQLQLKNNFS